MNYLPYVSWGLSPNDTATHRLGYFASWGLMGDAASGVWAATLEVAGYSIPTHAIWIAMPNTARSIMSIILIIFMSLQ